jgi:hypothetical protein
MSVSEYAARQSLVHAARAYRGAPESTHARPSTRPPRVATATTATSRIRQQECPPKLTHAFEAALNKADNHAALQRVIAEGFRLTRESAMRALSLPYLSTASSGIIEAEMHRRGIVLSVPDGLRLLARCSDDRRRHRWIQRCDLDGLTPAQAITVSRAMLAASLPVDALAKWLAACPTDILVGTLLAEAAVQEGGAFLLRLLAALRTVAPEMRPAQALLHAQKQAAVRFTPARDGAQIVACLDFGLRTPDVLHFVGWPESKDILRHHRFRPAFACCSRNFTFDKRRHALLSWARFQADHDLWYR